MSRNGRPFQLYVTDEFIERIDGWRAGRRPVPSRSEAVRWLVNDVLSNPSSWSDAALLEALRMRMRPDRDF